MPSSAPKTPAKAPAFAALAAMVGVTLAHQLVADTRSDESRLYRAERDLGGVWTICDGHTRSVRKGDVADDAECDAATAADLLASATIVLRCAPNLKPLARHQQLRAAVRFQNNTGKFCSSTGGKLIANGRLKAGCDALTAYKGIVTAAPMKGRSVLAVRRLKSGRYYNVIRGLVNRRANEHRVCVEGLK